MCKPDKWKEYYIYDPSRFIIWFISAQLEYEQNKG